MPPDKQGGLIMKKQRAVLARGQGRIVAITCLNRASENTKTGAMSQLYMLTTSHPVQAQKTGAQKRVCGDCALLDKVCYVQRGKGSAALWKAIQGQAVEQVPDLPFPVRLGADGDPAYCPPEIIEEIVEKAPGHTGYTHQWHKSANLQGSCMASIDGLTAKKRGVSPAKLRQQARGLGYRTFRVLGPGEKLLKNEIMCPNYTHGVQCADCLLCSGKKGPEDRRKDIAILGHGSGKKGLE